MSNDWTFYAGSDESGKGDYFGPLVVVTFACDIADIPRLQNYGVKDSKLLSEERINTLAEKILLDFRGQYQYVVVLPEQYNPLYKDFSKKKPGLNEMLAFLHSKTIGDLYKKHKFQGVVIDKFANETMIKKFISNQCDAPTMIVTNAEKDTIVAAASIIARYLFVKNLNDLSQKYNVTLLKGASNKVKELRNSISPEILPFVVKMHFKP